MGAPLLKRLKSLIKATPRENRNYRRFALQASTLLKVDAFEKKALTVSDISFGGLQVAVGAELAATCPRTGQVAMTIHLLDLVMPLTAEVTRVAGDAVGCKFAGQQVETLYALHGLVEGLRLGADLAPEGDAPAGQLLLACGEDCRVSAKLDANGACVKLSLKYTLDHKTWSLEMDNGRIVAAGPGDRRGIQTSRIERRVVRDAIFILSSVAGDDERRAFAPTLMVCYEQLGLKSVPLKD